MEVCEGPEDHPAVVEVRESLLTSKLPAQFHKTVLHTKYLYNSDLIRFLWIKLAKKSSDMAIYEFCRQLILLIMIPARPHHLHCAISALTITNPGPDPAHSQTDPS